MTAVTTMSPSAHQNRLSGVEALYQYAFFDKDPTAETIFAVRLERPSVLRAFEFGMLVCGATSGSTDAAVYKNGAAVTGASASIAHDDADGSVDRVAPTSETTGAAGDLFEVRCSAVAGTPGTGGFGKLVFAEILGDQQS